MGNVSVGHIVVVGGGSGIGLATAREAIARNANVSVIGRSMDKLQSVQNELGPRCRIAAADVLKEDELGAAFETIGPFDHLFVSAAEGATAPLADLDRKLFANVLDSKIWGGVHVVKNSLKFLSGNGSITFIAGLAGRKGYPGYAMAGAANAGIEAIGRNLAVELAPRRVNVVCAGVIDTPMLDAVFGTERDRIVAELQRKLPVRRIGTPADIADAVLFLMGNTFMSGATLLIDGGDALV